MTTLLTTPVRTAIPLESGDHLDALEFRRRYTSMSKLKKAELIQGVVLMPSPVRMYYHGAPHADLLAWAGVYKVHTPGVVVGDNATMRLDDWNEPQPDICIMIDPSRGGQARLSDGYLIGAPEFVAEIAASSVSYDLHQKKAVYAQFGVREYLVWRVLDGEIDWFVLKDGAYDRLPITADGVVRSVHLPGLWLATASLLQGDLVRVHTVLRQGLEDPGHAAFIDRK